MSPYPSEDPVNHIIFIILDVLTGHYCGEPGINGDMTLLNIVMQPSRMSLMFQ